MPYYSQHGEDFILDVLFKGKDNGFFVEVGCIDGKRFSNTYFFEMKGWKGICVEPHLDYYELLRINRPGSIIVPSAAGEKDEGEVTFFANARGTLSSLDPTTEERWKRDFAQFFSGFVEQKVSKKTLTTIFSENHVKGIDILSVDVEGYEAEVLSGLDFAKYRPEVIVCECEDDAQKQKIEALILPHGYYLLLHWGGNLFFSRRAEHKKLLAGKKFTNIHLVYTAHPLDKTVDEERNITIDLAGPARQTPFLKRVMRKLFSPAPKNNPQEAKPGRVLAQFYDVGFHGDQYLIDFVFSCAGNSELFIETGTNVGSTLHFMAKNFPEMKMFSCEPDRDAFRFASSKVKNCPNAEIRNELSPEFLYRLCKEHAGYLKKTTLFWLDSHGYGFKWPLREEVNYITSAFDKGYVFIDDFRVPGQPQFGYDQYDGQECSIEFIRDSFFKGKKYTLVYPAYPDKTSGHHPLRGWVLICFGQQLPEIPQGLAGKVSIVEISEEENVNG